MFNFLTIPYANAAVDMTAFGKLMNPIISNIFYPIIEFVFGLALVIFIYGVAQLISHGDDADARKKGQSMILYGTIGLFIMVAAWGIIHLISGTIIDIVK